VIEQAKASNDLARRNNTQLRVVIGLLALYGAVLVVVAISGIHIVNDLVVMERRLDGTVGQINDLATQMRDTEKKVDSVKSDTDTIREDRETQPRVELVEEQDPDKAKEAPLKVRIMPPSVKRAPKPHDSAGIDVPLSKDVVIKDADPLDGETDGHTEP
jgi:predicted MPP superfamily phosphohydrolase